MSAPFPLRPAGTLATFVDAPVGRYLAGEGVGYWCADERWFGIVLWGRPDRAAIERLTRALVLELDDAVPPHRSLVDASLLEAADPAAFAVLQQYVVRHHAALRRQVTRLALVRPSSLAGAVVAGFYQVLDAPYPTRAFDALGPALQWLEAPARWEPHLAALRAELSGVAPLLGQLRGVLVQGGNRTELAAAARALGLSARTLQRRLGDLGTSFGAEQHRARLLAAQRLLIDSDVALTEVAAEAGFASQQHFSAAFRKAFGKTPSAFRSARRHAQRQ